MIDRYSKIVLTVIAGALVYLCVVMTAFPAVQAQSTTRAGEMINQPIEAVIVGWRVADPLTISASRPLPVQTERSTGTADRVVIVGWEENGLRDRANSPMTPIISNRGQNLPVTR
jgi:hypothetical protein